MLYLWLLITHLLSQVSALEPALVEASNKSPPEIPTEIRDANWVPRVPAGRLHQQHRLVYSQQIATFPTPKSSLSSPDDEDSAQVSPDSALALPQVPTELQADEGGPPLPWVSGQAATALEQNAASRMQQQASEYGDAVRQGPQGLPRQSATRRHPLLSSVSVSSKKHVQQPLSNDVVVRPSAGKEPDKVQFGMYAKSFYGADVKSNKFMIDLIMTLKWVDKRVAKVIPDGMETMTLGNEESARKIWLPGVEITNRDIRKYELISTTVQINKKGEVTKVERSNTVVKKKFDLQHFPFDEQDLLTKIASTKYMLSEVELVPDSDPELSGVKDGIFYGESYELLNWKTSSVEDVDGALQKSRGVLNLQVKRMADKYWQSHLIPLFLIICISWGVFFFPYIGPFITPRLALSILALLSFTNLDLKMASQLPEGAPYNWNDLLNNSVQCCMFSTIILNIFCEVAFHQFKTEDVAKGMNHECKILLPFVGSSVIFMVLANAGPHGMLDLATVSIITKIFLICTVGVYTIWCFQRVNGSIAAMRRKEAAVADAKPGGRNAPLP